MKTKKKSAPKFEGKVMVKAPKGFHWMEEGGRYFLMKHDEFKPHKGASLEAPFKQMVVHREG